PPRTPRPASSRFAPRQPTQNASPSQVQWKPELLGENQRLSGAFQRPLDLAALEVDNSSDVESARQTERMLHALRQCHRLAHSQRPVGMAKVEVTPGRKRVGADTTSESHRVRQGPMRAGIIQLDALLEMMQRP